MSSQDQVLFFWLDVVWTNESSWHAIAGEHRIQTLIEILRHILHVGGLGLPIV